MIALIIFLVSVLDPAHSACPPGTCVSVQCDQSLHCGLGMRYHAQGGGCGCCPACIPDVRIGHYLFLQDSTLDTGPPCRNFTK